MHIAIIGAGYVGLVSAACFAEFGVSAICVDQNPDRIARLRAGEMPIYEPGLEALVATNVAAGRLTFSTDLITAVRASKVVFLAVGTPSRHGDGHADLSYVHAAAREVAEAMPPGTVIVTKSTVPVGTGRALQRLVGEVRSDAAFDIASNPEFLREGAAINDFLRPDRVVIGVESDHARTLLRQLYRPLYLNETPIVFTSLESAETIKYAANAFLATKITFINEMADLCERTGADVQVVARAIGLDGRIGGKFLHPGPGFGGSCFPKDLRALAVTAQEYGAPLRIVETVADINAKRKQAMAARVLGLLGEAAAGATVAVLGVTFKPNTDDMREAPSLEILPALQAAGVTVRAYDPAGTAAATPLLPGVAWYDNAYAPLDGADLVLILTEWHEFRALDLARVKSLLTRPVMVDLRNIYTLDEMAAAGFEYHSVGRTPVLAGAA